MITLVVYVLAAFAAALVLVPVCRSLALRLGYIAAPKTDRWHQRHTALMGGVAIAAVVVGGSLTLHPFKPIAIFVVTGAAIAAFGLIDDVLTLKPATKLVVQIALASAYVFFGARLHWVQSMTLDAMLTIAWIVAVTNAFNLLDNMDGLAAGIGAIVAVALLADFARYPRAASEAAYLALLIGSLCGFLIYNFNPASIFMGDSGSLFIGLTLAAMSLEPVGGARTGTNLLAVIGAPLLVLLIPIFDTTLVTVSRLLSGRSPSQGGRDHSSHRLVAIGLSERAAVRVLWTLALLGGGIGLLLRKVDPSVAVPIAATFILAVVIFAVYLARVRVYDSDDNVLLRSGKITPIVADFMYKRRVAEVLLDLCLVPLCYYVAYRLRFEGREFTLFFPRFLASLPIVISLQFIALYIVGAYRGVWRHFGLMDGVVFAKGVALGTLSIVVAILYLYRFENYSRGVFIIYAAMLMLALSGSRASFRLIGEYVRRRRTGRRLVVYGASAESLLVLREFLSDPTEPYTMIGFIDDAAQPKTRIQGYPVLGGYDALTGLIDSGALDLVLIASRHVESTRLTELERLCRDRGVSLSRVQLRIEQLVAS